MTVREYVAELLKLDQDLSVVTMGMDEEVYDASGPRVTELHRSIGKHPCYMTCGHGPEPHCGLCDLPGEWEKVSVVEVE